MKELLLPVAIKRDACAIRQEVFFFDMDDKSSDEDFDKLKAVNHPANSSGLQWLKLNYNF